MLSALIAGGLLTAVAAVIGAGVSSYANWKSTENTNSQNAAINKENLDYNAAMTQAQWERDDTAHQREVADLEKAGLSPLAATGGTQTTQALGAPNPIAMQAPQVSSTALINSLLGASEQIETTRHNKAIEQYRSTELENQSEELRLRASQLDIENKKVENELKYQTGLLELQAQQIEETIRSHKKDEELRLSELEQRELEEQSKRMLEEIQSQAGGKDVPYMVCKDFNIYQSEMKLYMVKFNHFLDSIGAGKTASASSKAGNGSLGFNGQTPTPGYLAVGVTGSAGGSSSEYQSSDISQKQELMWKKFQHENKVPVYIPEGKYYRLNY